jgi:prevent-host-death family protein
VAILYKTGRRPIFSTVLTLTTAAARRKFSELVSRVWYTKQRVALTRYGQPLVAVVPIEDLARLEGRKIPSGRAAKPIKRTVRKK